METSTFRVEGEFIARTAQHMMLSDLPEKAIAFLRTSLVGPGREEAAHRILAGDATLTGDSTTGLTLVEDDATEYKKDLAYIYAGRISVKGVWYQPYQRARGFNEEDAAVASKKLEGKIDLFSDASLERWARKRVECYALRGEKVAHTKHGWFFLRKCNPPYLWKKNVSTFADAIEDCIQCGRTLYPRGSDTPHTDEPLPTLTTVAERYAFAKTMRLRGDDRSKILGELRRRMIVEQTGDQWIDLKLPNGTVVATVPKPPFVRWCIQNSALRHLLPAWNTVHTPGMRLGFDSAEHSDWIVGSGNTIEKYSYQSPLHEAAVHTQGLVQHEYGRYEFTVLNDANRQYYYGHVGFDIAVVPDLHPDRLEQIVNAELVITEQGGALAHLAQVATEKGIPMIRIPDAVNKFRRGMPLEIDLENGRLRIPTHENFRKE